MIEDGNANAAPVGLAVRGENAAEPAHIVIKQSSAKTEKANGRFVGSRRSETIRCIHLECEESSRMPLERPPPLGQRVPNISHAISVQMPTWKDMCEMALGSPRVKMAQQNGYPRSFLHHDIVQLAQICKDYLQIPKDHDLLLFSNPKSAAACQEFLSSKVDKRGLDTPDLSQNILQLWEVRNTSEDVLSQTLFAVAFPNGLLNSAMIFWRLTGIGISSRLASHCLTIPNRLKRLEHFDEVWQQACTNSHRVICQRIVNLLQRASFNPSRAASLSSHDVVLYQTGMSAIYHVHQLLLRMKNAQSVVFGFPYELTLKMLETFGPGCTFYPYGSDKEISLLTQSLTEQAARGCIPQALWCECPSNPLLKTPNLGALRKLADRYGFVLIVDDTIGSFANVDLLDIADMIITSLTKSFSGYSNVMGGSVILNPASRHYDHLAAGLRNEWRNDLYHEDALQLEVNSRDFIQRVNRINTSTSRLVQYFKFQMDKPGSNLMAVHYPEICWSNRNYRAQMRRPTAGFVPGYGGVFTLEFASISAAASFFDAANVHKGPSLGANLTLMQPYVQTVFFREKEWAARNGVKETIVRISIGLEDPESLLETFRSAMIEAEKTSLSQKVGKSDGGIGSRQQGPLRSVL